MALRGLIYSVADTNDDIGAIIETLKWGQPAYLPKRAGRGTTIRIDALKNSVDRYAMYFHCQTSLVVDFRERYGDLFAYETNRALLFSTGRKPPEKALRHCIALALTYHLRSKQM